MQASKKKLECARESILVVKKNDLTTGNNSCAIFPAKMDEVFESISSKGLFMDRSVAENDEAYKQIIPYLVYQYKDSFFLMQRSNNCGEQRLRNCYALGIGGHVRESDLQNSQSILDWARREFLEEVAFTGKYKPVFLGLINDDSNAVGRVHLGLVFLLEGDSKNINIRSELKSGKLVTLEELEACKEELQSWDRIILNHLITLLEHKGKPRQAHL